MQMIHETIEAIRRQLMNLSGSLNQANLQLLDGEMAGLND